MITVKNINGGYLYLDDEFVEGQLGQIYLIVNSGQLRKIEYIIERFLFDHSDITESKLLPFLKEYVPEIYKTIKFH